MNDQPRVIGIVSNSWKVQLDQGQPLSLLIERAYDLGFRAIELRHGFLGEFETALNEDSAEPIRMELSQLAVQFPEVKFNPAIAIPCFADDFRVDDSLFLRGIEVAKALATSRRPHLRIVDTVTHVSLGNPDSIARAAQNIAALTQKLIDVNGVMSIEHAYQSWQVFQSVTRQARQILRQDADQLRCCFDPCNLLLTGPLESVTPIVEAIPIDELSMVHLKQRAAGQIQPDVGPGDLNWPQLLDSLDRRGYRGPLLFEVAPNENVWDAIQRSRSYLGIE